MIVFYIAGVLLIIFFVIPYIVYKIVFCFDKSKYNNPYGFQKGEQYLPYYDVMHKLVDAVIDVPYEDVEIKSWDNTKLHARLYLQNESAPLEILCHGYHGNVYVDFCGGLKLALDSGNNILLIDERAHGQSDGKCLTFGILERRDVLCWSNWVIDRLGADTKIVLVGISMGASTVLMAANLDLPENIKGIIADSGYTSPEAIIMKVGAEIHVPMKLLIPFVRMGAKLYGGFDLNETTAPKSLSKTKVPVLLIHGDDDRFVPCYMSKENFEACSSKKYLEIFHGAGHGLSYLGDTPRYAKAHEGFLKEVL